MVSWTDGVYLVVYCLLMFVWSWNRTCLCG
uniref:Uncharacterized protein n=1 Tax=Arundo donax TaxID=35708 RepID=A0A0A9FNB1_ARUDO